MPGQLEQLREDSVVADTGDLTAISKFRPRDCTTNPPLILRAAQQPESAELVREVVEQAVRDGDSVDVVLDRLAVRFGVELTKLVPGDVSTEADALLSFDQDAMIAKARSLVHLYEAQGVGRGGVLWLKTGRDGLEAHRRALVRRRRRHDSLVCRGGRPPVPEVLSGTLWGEAVTADRWWARHLWATVSRAANLAGGRSRVESEVGGGAGPPSTAPCAPLAGAVA